MAALSPHFPNIPSVHSNETFEAVIQAAKAQYDNYETYRTTAAEIEPLATEWALRYTQLIEGTLYGSMPSKQDLQNELRARVGTYIKYRQLRETVSEIREVYNKAIFHCSTPTLEEETLKNLQKLGIPLEDIKTAFNRIFTTELPQLQEQQSKITEIAQKIISALPNLSAALEKLAMHIEGYSSSWSPSYRLLQAQTKSMTPLVKSLVEAQMEAQKKGADVAEAPNA